MRLGIMCSGNGSNFENIVHSCPDHDVVLMVYNKKKLEGPYDNPEPLPQSYFDLTGREFPVE